MTDTKAQTHEIEVAAAVAYLEGLIRHGADIMEQAANDEQFATERMAGAQIYYTAKALLRAGRIDIAAMIEKGRAR
jgi:hypothetical protein